MTVPPNASWTLDTEPDNTLFTYTFSGSGCFGPESAEMTGLKTTLLFNEGMQFRVKAGDNPLRFILLSGPRLNEPIAWEVPSL